MADDNVFLRVDMDDGCEIMILNAKMAKNN